MGKEAEDIEVVVDTASSTGSHQGKSAPGTPPRWLSSPRNKLLAGLSLLTLIAVPAIVAPVVVTQQRKNDYSTSSPRDATDPASQVTAPTTSSDQSRAASNATVIASTTNTTAIKVPKGAQSKSCMHAQLGALIPSVKSLLNITVCNWCYR